MCDKLVLSAACNLSVPREKWGELKASFLCQLLNLCEAEDSALTKLPCYKSLPSLVPLRIAALSKCVPVRIQLPSVGWSGIVSLKCQSSMLF